MASSRCKPGRFLNWLTSNGHEPNELYEGDMTCVASGCAAYAHPMCRACRRQLMGSQAWDLYEQFRSEVEWWSEDEDQDESETDSTVEGDQPQQRPREAGRQQRREERASSLQITLQLDDRVLVEDSRQTLWCGIFKGAISRGGRAIRLDNMEPIEIRRRGSKRTRR